MIVICCLRSIASSSCLSWRLLRGSYSFMLGSWYHNLTVNTWENSPLLIIPYKCAIYGWVSVIVFVCFSCVLFNALNHLQMLLDTQAIKTILLDIPSLGRHVSYFCKKFRILERPFHFCMHIQISWNLMEVLSSRHHFNICTDSCSISQF